jgi:hypothetical protein
MTDEEFRLDLLASAASRADGASMGMREAFVAEMAERVRAAGGLPDVEACEEFLEGQRGRRLEIDAFAFDDADTSLHLVIAIRAEGTDDETTIGLTEARSEGFNRLAGVFEQARSGWLTANVEESRPIWSLARQLELRSLPTALRLHVLTDRRTSERLREIPGDKTSEGVPVTFQIWDVTRLKRLHEAGGSGEDLVVDLTALPGGGLPVLPAAVGGGDYEAYLAVVPGAALADIYIRHGSALLEGNVRTFLGRRGNINKGIAHTLTKEPARFFAYNNGIAATASAVTLVQGADGASRLTDITGLQIVNGAQTTASLAALRRDRKLPEEGVFVPMKLSVVSAATAETLIPEISRFSNSQNAVKSSDFFANHEFHRRVQQLSRRILAPAQQGSQVQTHWYYERARGQYLNDQAGMTPAKRDQFARMNPRSQLLDKLTLAKVETCFDLLPDAACRGAEKAFVAFAVRVADEWKDERTRSLYGDDWFRSAVARAILFRTTESIVSKAPWYASGTRSQVVAHTTAKLAFMARELTGGGHLDYLRIWSRQAADDLLQSQLLEISERVWEVLLSPPVAGQAVGEWAKQQACRKRVFDTEVTVLDGFESYLVERSEVASEAREQRAQHRVLEGLEALTAAINLGPAYWEEIQRFARPKGLLGPEDAVVLGIACAMPRRLPTDVQAARLMSVRARCEEAGYSGA